MLIRIRATGQVIDMIPAAAWPKVNFGMAELVEPERAAPKAETTALEPAQERAVTSAHNPPKRRPGKR